MADAVSEGNLNIFVAVGNITWLEDEGKKGAPENEGQEEEVRLISIGCPV